MVQGVAMMGLFDKKKAEPPQPERTQEVGWTQPFVLGKGFEKVSNFDALIGDDNTKRLFAELTADRDRTDVRPIEAYQTVLHSIHPGWKLRVLQLYWPDPEPRVTFYRYVENWRQSSEGLAILKEGLELALDQTSLPFGKRTFIEFIQVDEECITWWETLGALCGNYGVFVYYLERDEITKLSRWIFNPVLE
jgi:hypothetical protein